MAALLKLGLRCDPRIFTCQRQAKIHSLRVEYFSGRQSRRIKTDLKFILRLWGRKLCEAFGASAETCARLRRQFWNWRTTRRSCFLLGKWRICRNCGLRVGLGCGKIGGKGVFMMKKLKILIANDDGIRSEWHCPAGEGRERVWRRLGGRARAAVQRYVRPADDCRYAGDWQSTATDFPVPVQAAWSVDGTPADCVKVALRCAARTSGRMLFSPGSTTA